MKYHGWRIAWALAITQTVGYGVLFYAFSVFIEPMEAELGWARGQTSGAFSLALLLSGLVAFPVGRWVDRHGARGLMTLGSSLGVLLMLLWSFTQDLVSFYLIQAFIGLVMGMTFYDVAFTVVAVWFRRDRAKAILVITMVAGFASTIFIPLSTFLVETFPWRDALRILATILAVGTVPLHVLILRKHPSVLGLEPDGETRHLEKQDIEPETHISTREALRTSTFWWLSAAFALDRVTIVAIAAHSVPLLAERGFSPAVVAAAAGSIGLMQVVGRFLITPVIGRISLTTLSAITFVLHALALLSLLLIPGGVGLWLFASLFGISNGASTITRAALIADVYGSANYGSINGSMATLVALVQTVAPLGAGALHDLFGVYDFVLWMLVIVSVFAAFAVMRAQAPLISNPL